MVVIMRAEDVRNYQESKPSYHWWIEREPSRHVVTHNEHGNSKDGHKYGSDFHLFHVLKSITSLLSSQT